MSVRARTRNATHTDLPHSDVYATFFHVCHDSPSFLRSTVCLVTRFTCSPCIYTCILEDLFFLLSSHFLRTDYITGMKGY